MKIDKNGDSELMIAADEGKLAKVQELLAVYSVEEINYQNEYGNSALYLSANHRHDEITAILITAGANPLLVNCKGETAEQARARQDAQDIQLPPE